MDRDLLRKLGYTPGMATGLWPDLKDYRALLHPDWDPVPEPGEPGSLDLVHLFCAGQMELESAFLPWKAAMRRNGCLWVSWPKKASGVLSDLDENLLRDYGLANGLVDVKVVSVDEVWSALKFVYRVKDR